MIDQSTYLKGVTIFLFDLDGTLLDLVPSGHEAIINYAGILGHAFEQDAQNKGLLWSHTYWADVGAVSKDRKALDEEGFWRKYVRRYLEAMAFPADRLGEAASMITQHFINSFKPKRQLAPGTKELLWDLRTQGYTVGLIANRREPLTGTAIEYGIIEHFNFTLSAGQVESWKPDALIFKKALELAGGPPPEKAVCIGDNYYTDGLGAKQVGMRMVLLDKVGIYQGVAEGCLLINALSDLKQHIPKRSLSEA